MESERSINKIHNESTPSCTSSIVCCLLKTRPFAHICAFSGILEPVRRWRRENNSMHSVARVTPSTYTHRLPYSMVACIRSGTWCVSVHSLWRAKGVFTWFIWVLHRGQLTSLESSERASSEPYKIVQKLENTLQALMHRRNSCVQMHKVIVFFSDFQATSKTEPRRT